ncbi:atlastin-like [Amphibalanus amphitrite]|uniref:atlastin-like n=1 Tax=Amphibalanus amphitrite TaxID=1232801 RepID=UPI001C90CDF5|nr:atlastin-like [Amphibalanus amphitrite]XP_043220495.1 atlastin-like [Amphibalanus amphitrite]
MLPQPTAGEAAGAGGRAVPILVPSAEGRLELDEAALRSVLLQDDVRHLPVVVVAVAGAFRKGKSFLLSLLLRYLERGGAADWTGAPDEPLTGFAWRSGRQRHTVGIHMWSRPTLVRLPSGEQVAVVLMDTQGAFDDRTAVAENATVFALSALMSSVQIYNVSRDIGTSDLQHLQLFSEFGSLTAAEGHGTAFQRLLFLVRDWQSPSEAPYGTVGGQKVLREVLDSPPGTHEELRQMRQHVRRCFSDIDCYLLPHPGKMVATSSEFTGCPRDIDDEFLLYVERLARLLFRPEHLLVKKSGGETLTAADLVTHFVTLYGVMASGELPEPRSLVNTMSEAQHRTCVDQASILYAEQMRQVCDADTSSPGVPEEELQRHHETALQRVVAEFEQKKKMLGSQGAQFKQQMFDAVESWRHQFFHANKTKNDLTDARDNLCCNKALMDARDQHRQMLSDLLSGAAGELDGNELQERHARSRDDLLCRFDARTVDCIRRQLVASYRNQLKTQLENSFEEAELFLEQRRSGQAGAETDRQAMNQARQQYRDIMDDCLRGGPLSEGDFASQQRAAEEEARRLFSANRGPAHGGAQRVDQLFDRGIQEESQNAAVANFFTSVLNALMPTLVSLATKAVAKCVIM